MDDVPSIALGKQRAGGLPHGQRVIDDEHMMHIYCGGTRVGNPMIFIHAVKGSNPVRRKNIVTYMGLLKEYRVEKYTASLGIPDYKRLFFRLKYVFAYRAIAFQTASTAPSYQLARPILKSVSEKLRIEHLIGIYADGRPKLSVVISLLKIHPWLFYRFVRRLNYDPASGNSNRPNQRRAPWKAADQVAD
ncbi:hypothetical protein OKW45_005253 [Paraburkholderia sp. WSM4175]